MYFSEDETASKTAKYAKVTRKTINKLYDKFRVRIASLIMLIHTKANTTRVINIADKIIGFFILTNLD